MNYYLSFGNLNLSIRKINARKKNWGIFAWKIIFLKVLINNTLAKQVIIANGCIKVMIILKLPLYSYFVCYNHLFTHYNNHFYLYNKFITVINKFNDNQSILLQISARVMNRTLYPVLYVVSENIIFLPRLNGLCLRQITTETKDYTYKTEGIFQKMTRSLKLVFKRNVCQSIFFIIS